MSSLDSFLQKITSDRTRRCKVCEHAELKKAFAELYQRKAQGEQLALNVSMNYFHKHYVVGIMNVDIHRDTCLKHVAKCLKVKHSNGKPLNE